jgi:hypothetical protein
MSFNDQDRQAVYDAVSNRIMSARIAIAKLTNGTGVGTQIEELLFKAQSEASDLAAATAATCRSVRDGEDEVERLRKALEHYTHCRHGEVNDRCTMEARAALYPYMKKQIAQWSGKA